MIKNANHYLTHPVKCFQWPHSIVQWKKIRYLSHRFSERLGWWTTSRQQEKISFQKLTPWIMIRLKQFGEEKDRSVTWNTCLAPLLATESKAQWHINGWCWLIDLLLRNQLQKNNSTTSVNIHIVLLFIVFPSRFEGTKQYTSISLSRLTMADLRD